MDTETKKALNAEERDKQKWLALRPMRAFYFDRHSNAIGDKQNGEPVAGVADAKHKGRAMGARGFRIWLGKEAEERKEGPTSLYYIQPWYGARYQQVHKDGFFRTFENIIKREERREGLQFMRRLVDPAYKEEVKEDGA